jgi:nucleoside-diphosphate kinase
LRVYARSASFWLAALIHEQGKTGMPKEQTLSIIKPDGVQKNLIGEIFRRFEKAGLEIVAAKMVHLSKDQAESFYAVHKSRPFYKDLVKYMRSGPVMVQVLEGEGAVETNRRIMGATNPADADKGTIRADYADSIEENIVHGSDGPATAAQEIEFFFGENGTFPRTR